MCSISFHWILFHLLFLFHFSWMLVKEPRKTLEALDLSIIVMCILCLELFCQRKPLTRWVTPAGHDAPEEAIVLDLKATVPWQWLSVAWHLQHDATLGWIQRTPWSAIPSPFCSRHWSTWRKWSGPFGLEIRNTKRNEMALQTSQFLRQKCRHKLLPIGKPVHAEASTQQIHVKILYHLMACSCSKTASRFTLSTEGLVHNPTLHCETSHGWKFFWTWRLGKKGKCAGRGLHMSSLSW